MYASTVPLPPCFENAHPYTAHTSVIIWPGQRSLQRLLLRAALTFTQFLEE